MDMSIGSRVKRAWNAFLNRDPYNYYQDTGMSYSYRPDRPRLTGGSEKTIINSIYNRIAIDVSTINIKHVQLDQHGRYASEVKSGLNSCLTLSANIDQTGRAFILDAVMSLLDEGCVALVPVDTDIDPERTDAYDILSIRTAKILEWRPSTIRIRIYNDITGNEEEMVVKKEKVAIIENPLYSVMNEPNSTMQRLIRKLALLDNIDEKSSSEKLNLIVQLPYLVKTEARKKQAEERRKDIESQLGESKYGIAYTDGTEHITQLNRPLENNLMGQIEYLTSMLYSQLGITKEVMDGTANETTMLNYNNRTIEPIISAITEEMNRKFLTKTARSQGKAIRFFRDPFKLVPIDKLADLADRLTRNEITTANEFRQIIGMAPSQDPGADELRNKNLYKQPGETASGDTGIQNEENQEAEEPQIDEALAQQLVDEYIKETGNTEISDDDLQKLVEDYLQKEQT